MSYVGTSNQEVEEQKTKSKVGGQPDLLDLCRAEMVRAIGFEQDAELLDDRTRALNYYKGDMTKDVPSLPNRSKAVSSDISDAVETILPDLMEIFTGGDDVVAFIPQKPEDEDAAKQETAYLNHVTFQENPGFLNFYTAFKDALLLKTGIFMFEWVQDIEESEEEFSGKNPIEMQLASQDGEVVNVKQDPMPDGADLRTTQPTYSFTIRKTKDNSCAKYWAVPPDDFAAAPDTINIQDATYCVMRSRPRVQDLIAEGYDAEKVRNLPAYSVVSDTTMQQARDNAGESDRTGNTGDETSDDLRQVEIRKHYIRVLGEENKLELWCVVTDCAATEELDREEVERIPYAIGSPYLIAHRLYGRSLADMLVEIQKIKTALTRAVLDSTYFALNQRNEVAMDQANDYTISDLLRNEPGSPIRSKTGTAIRAITAGGLGFDPYGALEYFSTVAESRTGVVRNAQGLNPDTLHDTASGAMMLLSAAQKRTKMIARIMAETMVKQLYLGLHAIIRENCSSEKIANLLGKWVPVNPTQWAERNAMTVEVGLGASGKDMEIAAMNQIIGLQKAGVEAQGGTDGPLVTKQNLFKSATDMARKLGVKAPEEYFSDPSAPPDPNAPPPPPPPPNPELIKVQGEQQLQQAKLQGEMALGKMKVESEQQIQATKAQSQAAVNTQQQQLEHQRLQAEQANTMALEQMKIASSERIAIEVARINAEAKIESARISAKNQTDDGAAALDYQQSHETTTA